MSEHARLAWRCRRGTLELDLLLRGFLDREYDRLPDTQKRRFAELLEAQDPVIWDWLWGRCDPPDGMREIVERIRRSAQD